MSLKPNEFTSFWVGVRRSRKGKFLDLKPAAKPLKLKTKKKRDPIKTLGSGYVDKGKIGLWVILWSVVFPSTSYPWPYSLS